MLLFFLTVTLLARPQAQPNFISAYVGQIFLVREHGGLYETVKIKKEDAERYKGICDKAVEVKTAQFTKDTLQFEVEDIGMVLPGGSTPQQCVRADETLLKKLIISGINGQESQSELEMVIGRILQTPEAYLESHGVSSVIPEVETQTPSTNIQTAPKNILNVTPWFPKAAIERREPLHLSIEMTVGIDGKLHAVKVLSGLGSGLDDAFLRVFPLWRYQPARKDGQAVASQTNFTATFNFAAGAP